MIQPSLAELIFLPSPFLWPAALLLVLSGIMVALSYRHAALPLRKKWIAGGLKLLGFCLLAFCMLEPMWTGQAAQKGANHFVVLADNGRSLDVIDPAYDSTRGDYLTTLLANDEAPAWLETLNDDFKLDRFLFDTRLQRSEDFSTLDYSGYGSALYTALDLLATRYADRPLAGVLLLSDGNATDRGEELDRRADFAPIYPVMIGSDEPLVDLAVRQVTTTSTSFEDAPVTIKADIASLGFQGSSIEARLLDSNSNLVEQLTLDVKEDKQLHAIRFRIRPDKPGVSHYQLVVQSLDEHLVETTMHNNTYSITVDQGHDPSRILYVCGRPNWEYKFLRRAMEADEQIKLVGLIRIAKREPKFEFRGRDGEGSNPLFRGFGKQDEEAEFDQPVFVRLNTKDSDELANGFPREAEDLFAYDAIVLDDLEAEFFTQDQLALLERFVAHRGGGLLMLGGLESFQQGGYDKSLLGKMSPVYLDRHTEAISYQPAQWALTREGWLTPWIRLRETEDDDTARLQEMPPFKVLNRARSIKPGARVIGTAEVEGTTYPALAVQRYGKGQTGAFMIGDYWRWGFAHESFQEDMAKSWRQIMRWLVSDVPKRLTTEVIPGEAAHQPHEIQVHALDASHEPVDQALVQVKIAYATTNELTLTGLPDDEARGVYTVSFMPPDDGPYTAEATLIDHGGIESGKTLAGWSVNRHLEEFARLSPNRSAMESLAQLSGGQIIKAEKLDELNALLDQREMPKMETWTRPAWHTPFFFLLALGCFIGEWFIRRRSHLA